MKASNFSDAQKAFIIKQGEDGTPVRRSAVRRGSARQPTSIGRTSMPVWWRLKQLEDENARLKRIVADLTLDREMLQHVIKRKH